MRTSNELRQAFLDFFASKDHRIMPGISLVPTDPSLLLTGAGVVPFRAVIEGREPPPAPRVATCQRCVRTTDIENVGKFGRYHTFFEMLGNFSFGDYYKRESLTWGWEFLTDVLRLDRDRIWGTIYPDDEEAFTIWTQDLGVPAERIIRLEDNFWGPVAETGACGPDSEFYYDLGPEFGCGKPDCKPGCDCDRYLEFWNHVFTELYKNADGSYSPLPQRNIDTGMGLERLTCVVQGKPNVYETDLFAPIMDRVDAILAGATGRPGRRDDWRKRVIADHSRAVTFLIMDGIYPENTGRGYVLRRLLRRAATFGRLLGVERPFMHELMPVVVEKMASGYPELRQKQGVIEEMVRREEERYHETLERGMPIFLERAREHEGGVIPGDFAWHVYETYGLPYDLMRELAAEFHATIDERGYQQAEAEARERARGHLAVQKELAKALEFPPTRFLGYDTTEAESEVLGVLRDDVPVERLVTGEDGLVVLKETPFYGEAGGQVGDTGRLVAGGLIADVLDTQRRDGVFLHRVRVQEGQLHPGMRVKAIVDAERRQAIVRAHTATHLLHAALRQVLGPHVVQRGSVVEPDRLRFDFAHPEPVRPEQLEQIERVIEEHVLADLPVTIEWLPREEALRRGAMALFGEKYGETVRVVTVPGFSIELCGGTHATRTGVIGLVKITHEGSVGAGVRRVEATTGLGALAYVQQLARRLEGAAALLQAAPDRIEEKIEALREQVASLRRQLQEARRAAASGVIDRLLAQRQEVAGVPVVAAQAEVGDPEAVRTLADALAERLRSGVVVLGAATNGKALFVAKVTPDVVQRGGHAGHLVRDVAKIAGGGGGGRPDFAQAGGREVGRIGDAVAAVPELVRRQLASKG